MCPQTVSDKTESQTKKYRAVIGSLLLIMVCTRPDIAAVVRILCRFMENREHWNGAMRIILYLKKTRMTGLTFNKINKIKFMDFAIQTGLVAPMTTRAPQARSSCWQ
jgi:hypothetical protein